MKKLFNLFIFTMAAVFFLSCTIGLGKAVDTVAPEISITSPAVDSVIRDSFAFKGTWSDDGEITSVSLTLANIASENESYSFEGTFESSENGTGTWEVKVNPLDSAKLIPDGSYEATIAVKDGGEHVTKQSRSIKIDNTAPIIVLQRPASKSEDSPDAYGQTFTLEGQAADDNDVSLIEVNIYNDEACTSLVHTVQLHNVPPTISLDVAKFVEGEENDYSKIYGETKKNGTKKFYVSIVAYDSAQRYPIEGNQSADDSKGNSINFYYLYEDISSKILSDYKITDVYHMINGTYTETDGERAAETISSVRKILDENVTSVGSFSLNPANNPYFTVSGRDALIKDGTDFTNTNNYITNGSSVVVEVSTGLDAIPLADETLKVYALPCDLNGIPTTTAVESRIYPETTKSKTGTSYRFVTVISTAAGFTVGSNYVFGVEGTDQKNNEVVNSGNGYGFHMSSSGAAPTLSVVSPKDTITYLKKGSTQRIEGSVTVEEGLPSLVILKGEDTIWTKNFVASEAVSSSSGKTYNFSFEILANSQGFSQTESTQNSYTIKASQEGQDTIVNKTIMYDVDGPSIDIQSVAPYAYKYINEAGEEDVDSTGEKIQYLNGSINAKFSIADDFDTVDETKNPPRYEFFLCEKKDISATSRKGEIPSYTVNSLKQEIKNIDTTLWKDAQGNPYKGPVTLRVTAYDRSGNESVAYASYHVDQDTDKPVILPNSPDSVTFTYTTQEALEAENKSSSASGGQVYIKLIDDDGLKGIDVYRQKIDDTEDVFTLTPTHEDISGTDIVYAVKLPSVAGYYRFGIKVQDIYGTENKIGPFIFRVTAPAPTITNITVDPKYITTKTGTAVESAETKFTNTVEISSTESPFYIFRKDTPFVENDITGVKPTVDSLTLADGSPTFDGKIFLVGITTDSSTVYKDIITNQNQTVSKTYYYVVYDKNWNDSNTKTVECLVDAIAPNVTLNAAPTRADTKAAVSSFAFQGTASDPKIKNTSNEDVNGSGIREVHLTVSGKDASGVTVSKTVKATGTTNWLYSLTYADDKTADDIDGTANSWIEIFAEQGEKSYSIIAIDNAGNKSVAEPGTFIYDTADPTSTISGIQDDMPGNGYTISGTASDSYKLKEITIKQTKDGSNAITATIPLTGTSKAWSLALPFKVDGNKVPSYDAPTDGTYSYEIRVYDEAGNDYLVKTFDTTVDTTAPTLSFDANLYDSVNSVSNIKGVNAINETNFRFEGGFVENKLHSIYYAFGNTVPSNPQNADVLDSEKWTDWSKATTGSSTWNFVQEFKTKGSDAAGLPEGSYNLYMYAVDKAGNVSTLATLPFDVDMADPVITNVSITADTGSQMNLNGNTIYFNGSLNVSATASDTNGLADSNSLVIKLGDSVVSNGTIADTSFTDETTKKVLSITATDIVGKTKAVTYDVYKDVTPPSILITNPDSDVAGDDALSGNVDKKYTFRGSLDDSGVGLETFKYKFVAATSATDDGLDATSVTDIKSAAATWSDNSGSSIKEEKQFVTDKTDTTNMHEGKWFLYVYALDKVGNESVAKRTFWVDLENPKLDIKLDANAFTAASATSSTKTGFKLEFKPSDTNGLAATPYNLKVEKDSTDYTSSVTVGSVDANGYYPVTITGDGNYTFTITANDISGKSTTVTKSVLLDTTGPALETTSPDFAEWQTSSNVKITGTATDASTVSGLYYKLNPVLGQNETVGIPSSGDLKQASTWTTAGWTVISGSHTNWSLTLSDLSDKADHQLYLAAVDSLGNASDVVNKTLKLDATAPHLEETTVGLSGKQINIQNKSSGLTLAGSFTETVSGLASIVITDDKNTNSKWTITPATGTTPAADPVSWTQNITIDNADNKLKDGEHVLTIKAVDKAGNATSIQRSVVVDTKAPDFSSLAPADTNKVDYTGVNEDQVWFKSNSVTINATGIGDSLNPATTGYASGILSVQYTTDDPSSESASWISFGSGASRTATVNCPKQGANTITVKVTDGVGNSVSKSTTVYVDTEAPVAPTTYSVTYINDKGSYDGTLLVNKRSQIVIKMKPTDATSGIASIKKGSSTASGPDANGDYTLTIATDDQATGGVNIEITDNVGNKTTWNPFKITVDNQAPTIKFATPKDADEATGTQVNGEIILEGAASDKGGAELSAIDFWYAVGTSTTWNYLNSITEDITGWTLPSLDTTSAFGSLTEPETVTICGVVSDTAGNRNLDTKSGTTVNDNTTEVQEGGKKVRKPSQTPSEINSSNLLKIIVDQDTDRPKITFTNLDLTGMGVSSGKTTYAYLNNTNILYGIVSDDDGVNSMAYIRKVIYSDSTAPAIWSVKTHYSDSVCETPVSDYAAGTYYIKESITPSGSGSFTISGIAEGANEIYFQVNDGTTTFTSSASEGPKLTGNESSPTIKTILYLRTNTVGPEISNIQFYRWDSTADNGNGGKGAYEKTPVALENLTSSYKFGGTKYTKVKVQCDVTDANGIKSVKIGDTAGTFDSTTGKYEIVLDLSSITTSGPKSFVITALDDTTAPITTTKNFDLTMDNTAPTMAVTSHMNGANIRSTFTLRGTVDDATASMKYLITSSSARPSASDWTNNAKTYSVVGGSSIVSWDITFDGDSLNSYEMHDADQKTYFVSLYGTAAASGTTYGILKDSSGTIVEKKSASDTEGDPTKKYLTKKPFYLHFQLTDDLGNTGYDDSWNLMVDPQGDIPVIVMTNPSVEKYAYYNASASDKFTLQEPEDYEAGNLPAGMTTALYRGAYGTASGRITISGYAEDDKTIKGLYMQIDPTYDPSEGFKWVGASDSLPNGNNLGKVEYGYSIEDIYHRYNGTTKGVTGIYIGDGTSWSIRLNANGEFNGTGTSNNTIAIKLFAVDEDGNIYTPGETEVFIITIDSGAPKIGNSVDFALWQYAWTNASATPSTVYTKKDNPSSSDNAYTDSGCSKGETAIATTTVDSDITNSITVGGKVYNKNFITRPYTDDMWLNGEWWLVGSVEDESGISSVKVGKTDIISTNCEEKTYSCTASGNHDYLVRYKVGNTTDNAYGKLTYTLTVLDVGDNPKENAATFSINYDNKAPVISDKSDASYNLDSSVVNTDGFYTLGSAVTESDGESGFARTVVYFKRTATNYENVYDVFLNKTSSPIAYSGLPYESGMYWQTETVTGINGKVLTTTVGDNVHNGGIVKFGGAIYTITGKTATTITLDGEPDKSLEGSTIYFGIGAVIDRSGNEGASNNATKIQSGEGVGYWNSIAGDNDFIVERVTTQGTKSIWEGNINTKNIPDGPIEIHYVVFDKAGNSSHGVVAKEVSSYTDAKVREVADTFVRNNAPMIASVTVATDYSGNGQADYEETVYVSGKTRYFSGTGKIKATRVASSVVIAGDTTEDITVSSDKGTSAFMTVKDTTWVKPEIVGGNGKLYYSYDAVKNATTNWFSKAKTNFKDSSNNDVTGSVDGGENYLNANDADGNATYVKGQELEIKIDGSDLAKITTNGTTTFNMTLYDSTEGGSPLTAAIKLLLDVQYQDENAPKSVILPFEWHGKGLGNRTKLVNGQNISYENIPLNNIYGADPANGHIELSSDWKNASGRDTSKEEYDDDPKVSGKISIRGYAFDDIRIKNIWIKMDDVTFRNPLANATGETAPETGYVKAASYSAGTWTKASATVETNGWAFNVYDGTSGTDAAKNLGQFYGSYFTETGHKAVWQLDLDTTNTTLFSNVVGTDKTLSVIVEAERGTKTGASPTLYSSTTAVETAGDTTLNTPSCKLDVVPYITGITRSATTKSTTTMNRSTYGEHPVAIGDTLTVTGFNLPAANTVATGTTAANSAVVMVGGTKVATTVVSGSAGSSFTMSVPSNSGELVVYNKGIRTLNDKNNNASAGNKDADSKYDNRYIRVWDVGHYFNESVDGNLPTFATDNEGNLFSTWTLMGFASVQMQRGLNTGSHPIYVCYDQPDKESWLSVDKSVKNGGSSIMYFPANVGYSGKGTKNAYSDAEAIGGAWGSATENNPFATYYSAGNPSTSNIRNGNSYCYYTDGTYSYVALRGVPYIKVDSKVWTAGYELASYGMRREVSLFKNARTVRYGNSLHYAYYDSTNKAVRYTYTTVNNNHSAIVSEGSNKTSDNIQFQSNPVGWIIIDGSSDGQDRVHNRLDTSKDVVGLTVSAYDAANKQVTLSSVNNISVNNTIGLSYTTATGKLKVAVKTITEVDTRNKKVTIDSAISDINGNPEGATVYRGASSVVPDGATYGTNKVSAAGTYLSIDVNPNDSYKPVIVYYANSSLRLAYSTSATPNMQSDTNGAQTWRRQVITYGANNTAISGGTHVQAKFDPTGKLHIVYRNNTGVLCYISGTGNSTDGYTFTAPQIVDATGSYATVSVYNSGTTAAPVYVPCISWLNSEDSEGSVKYSILHNVDVIDNDGNVSSSIEWDTEIIPDSGTHYAQGSSIVYVEGNRTKEWAVTNDSVPMAECDAAVGFNTGRMDVVFLKSGTSE